MSTVIFTDGVLRKSDGQLLPDGIDLARKFSDSIVCFGQRADTAEWLGRQGLAADLVLDYAADDDPAELLKDLRFIYGHPVDMVITPDPQAVTQLLAEGYLVLGFFHPYFARPEWRPGYSGGIRPWDELSKQVADAARDHANDERLGRHE